jgi:hypothetical protein
LTLDKVTEQITGTATVGAITATIESNLGVYNAKLHPLISGTGSYTFLLPAPTGGDTTVPQGTGYGTATISSAGIVKLSGVLGDGTKFSTSTVASKDLTFPLFVPLYSKLGALAGTVSINPTPGVSDFNGNLRWFKPATTSSRYPGQFALQPTMIGSRYDKTIPSSFNSGNAYLSILTSSSDSTIVSSTTPLTSLSATKTTATPLPGPVPYPNKLTFTVAPGTGLFSGSFLNGTNYSFKGAVFQKQSLGAGVFLSKTQSGSVLVETSGTSSTILEH